MTVEKGAVRLPNWAKLPGKRLVLLEVTWDGQPHLNIDLPDLTAGDRELLLALLARLPEIVGEVFQKGAPGGRLADATVRTDGATEVVFDVPIMAPQAADDLRVAMEQHEHVMRKLRGA